MKNIFWIILFTCCLSMKAQVYAAINTDTTITTKELLLANQPYLLEIKQYCLNDSAVKPKASPGVIFHNYTSKVSLYKEGKSIFSRTINKNSFGPRISNGLYPQITLDPVSYDFERDSRLYFIAQLINPASGKMYEFNFAIIYQGEKTGEISWWGARISK